MEAKAIRVNHLSLIFLFLYTFSIGFYTFYGLYKSYNEYFCTQKRQGGIDYKDAFHLDILNMSDDKGGFVVNINQMLYTAMPNYNSKGNIINYTLSSGYLNLNHDYKVDDNYFNLACDPDYMILRKENYKIVQGYAIFEEVSIVAHKTSDGFLKVENRASLKPIKLPFVLNDTNLVEFNFYNEHVKLHGLYCVLSKSTETCELLQSTSDKFFATYLYFSLIIAAISILSFFNLNDYFIIRIINTIANKINNVDVFKTSNFCNPVDGKPLYLKKGDTISVLTNGGTNLIDLNGIDRFNDLEGEYTIMGSQVLCKLKNKRGELFDLGQPQIQNLRAYFKIATIDSGSCVVNDDEDHFIKTKEILVALSQGKLINTKEKFESSMVLKINDFELTVLTNAYVNLKKLNAKHLLEHNWRFFSQSYNMKALFNCLNKKTWSRCRPGNVKNSQWKKYSSDVAHILNGYGLEQKCQVKSKPSAVVKEMEGIDWKNFPVAMMPKEVEILTVKKPDQNFSIEQSLVKLQDSVPIKEFNFKSGLSGEAIKGTPYRESLYKLNLEVATLSNKMKLSGAKNVKDLKKEAESIKTAIFDFDKKVEELKPILLDPVRVFSERDKRVIKKAGWQPGSKGLEYFKKIPVGKHDLLKVGFKDLLKDINQNFDWVLRIENQYEALAKLEEDLEDFKHTTEIRKEVFNLSEFVHEKILKKPKKNNRLIRRSGKQKKGKNKNREFLKKSGKTVHDKYLCNDFNECVASINEGKRMQNCRARTYYNLKYSILKEKNFFYSETLTNKYQEKLSEISFEVTNVNSYTNKEFFSDLIKLAPNLFELLEGLEAIV